MQYKQITNTDLKVSTLCLGGGNFGEKLNESEVFRVLDEFVEAGGNFIDTAQVYCRWVVDENTSEQYIGRWLKEKKAKDNIIVATKGGHYDFQDKYHSSRVKKAEVEKDLLDSLKTLHMDSIPLYYLHRDDPELEIEEIVDFCEDFVKEGKIRYYAFSNYSLERAKRAQEYAQSKNKTGFVALSNQYSLASLNKTAAQDETLSATDTKYLTWHKTANMPLIPYTSVANGFYEKLFQSKAVVKDGVLLTKQSELGIHQNLCNAFLNTCNLRRYEFMLELKEEYGYSMIALSLAYLINQSFPVIPIVSVRDTSQLKDIIKAGDIKLEQFIVKKLELMEE